MISATAKAPNALGVSKRAGTMPSASVANRIVMLLTNPQAKPRRTRPPNCSVGVATSATRASTSHSLAAPASQPRPPGDEATSVSGASAATSGVGSAQISGEQRRHVTEGHYEAEISGALGVVPGHARGYGSL